jgi:hypothetical protein
MRMKQAENVLKKPKIFSKNSKKFVEIPNMVILKTSFLLECVFISGRLDDETLTQIFKMKLMSPPCQNQGYILDGYPKTFDQAHSLFAGK